MTFFFFFLLAYSNRQKETIKNGRKLKERRKKREKEKRERKERKKRENPGMETDAREGEGGRSRDCTVLAELLSATRCNTLQHTVTYCNMLQHCTANTATYCNTQQTLQHTATQHLYPAGESDCNADENTATYCITHTATH